MSRNLTTAAAAAVASEVPIRTVAVSLDFPSGVVRFNGSPASIFIGGAEFLGVGGLGAITVIDESSELRSYDLSISLSGIPRDSIALALTQAYQGRRGTVWEVPLDPTSYQPIADPILFFRGRMDQLDVSIGDSAAVAVKLLNRLGDWERPKLVRYTDQDQKRLHPGDRGFEFVNATTEKEIEWPGKEWSKANPGAYK